MELERQVIGIAVVFRGDAVLVGRRAAHQTLAGHHEFPGGKQLPSEPLEWTVARECLEETGLEVTVGKSLCYCQHQYSHATVCLTFFECVPLEPDRPPRLPYTWVPRSELDQLDFPPANDSILQLLRETAPPGGPSAEQEFPESL